MIYLDNNATTCLSEGVKKCIRDNLDLYANPSSIYKESKEAAEKILSARKSVAKLINAPYEDILFTGCATESNNTVFCTCCNSTKFSQPHIIVSAVEHSAILETAKYYEKYHNIQLTILPVDSFGRIDENKLVSAIQDNTVLVSIMLVNNEIGNIYPIKDYVKAVKKKNPYTLFHTDATQAIGKMLVDISALGVDFLTLSGHKFHAPKGVGALYVKNLKEFKDFVPFMKGGHQENSHRAGTENILSILAMGVAAEETKAFCSYDLIAQLRDEIESKICAFKAIPVRIIGDTEHRSCNTSCVLYQGISGIDICNMINSIADVCISSGSACNSVELKPSHVMNALNIDGIPIRISLSRYTTKDEINKFCNALFMTINKLKQGVNK